MAENFLKMPYDAISAGFGDREWTDRNTARYRNLVPAQNLFYSRWLVNMAEDAVNDAIGAKETR